MGGCRIDDDWEFTSQSSEVRTVVLVGRTGNGKSATGNSILGRKGFKSRSSLAGVTSTCERQSKDLEDGTIINVIDTPGLFDFSDDPEVIGKEIMKCIKMAADGIHAFLVVLSVRSRFSREEQAAIHGLQRFFGGNINDYMIVVFTGGDDLEENDETLDDYLGRACPEELKEIVQMCGNRQVLFDNKSKDENKESEQRKQLLALVNTVIENNKGTPYTDQLFIEMKQESEKQSHLNAEVVSLEGHSNILRWKEPVNEGYGNLPERITEMVDLKLKEIRQELEQKLAEERKARLEAEDMAEKSQNKSSDEISRLRHELENAQRETQELRNQQAQHRSCAIL